MSGQRSPSSRAPAMVSDGERQRVDSALQWGATIGQGLIPLRQARVSWMSVARQVLQTAVTRCDQQHPAPRWHAGASESSPFRLSIAAAALKTAGVLIINCVVLHRCGELTVAMAAVALIERLHRRWHERGHWPAVSGDDPRTP
jgi:hypothetical protein